MYTSLKSALLSGLLAASMLLCFAPTTRAGVDIGGPVDGTPPTLWVSQSDEPIVGPMVSWNALPRRVSIDALTALEIKHLKIDAYRSRADCMQWFFLKKGSKKFAVGAALGRGQGVIKINGKLRLAGLGGNGVGVNRFDALPRSTDGIRLLFIMPHFEDISLSIETSEKPRATAYSGICSMLRARCRRYEVSGLSANWAAGKPSGVGIYKVPLLKQVDTDITWVSEDMCPMSDSALVEKSWASRAWGDGSGILLNGFVLNTSLKRALADVADEAKIPDKQ